MTGLELRSGDIAAISADPVVPAQRTASPTAPHDPARRDPGREESRAVALWPPERDAAARLARARDTLSRTDGADERWRVMAHRHVDVAEAAARDCLARPAPTGAGVAERAAAERGRAALARMLDPDPATRAAGTLDVTCTWPAQHLRVLQDYAEHERGHRRPDHTGDAVADARAAVDAIPVHGDDADTDGFRSGHLDDLVDDDGSSLTAAAWDGQGR